MTTLRNYLDNGSLWSEIKNIEDFPFIGEDPIFLDTLQKIEYGDRILSPSFLNVEINFAAKVIVKLFSDKWNKVIESEINKINLLGDGNTLKKIDKNTVTVNDEETEILNKVSSYNDDSLLVEGGNSNSLNSNKNVTGGETVDETRISYENLFNNLNSVERTNIINIVLSDVSKYLTLNLY